MTRHLITIVEDEAPVALDLARALEAAGFRARVARSAVEAVAQARGIERPAGVVLGVQLDDGEDGSTLAQTFRAMCGPQLAIVFAPPLDDEGTRMRAAACDPVGYFAKPINPGLIAIALRAELQEDEA